jgi:lysyl-tRNA synthetase class II
MMKESELFKTRREKIENLKAEGIELYPNNVEVKDKARAIQTRFADMDKDALDKVQDRFPLPEGLWPSGTSARGPL